MDSPSEWFGPFLPLFVHETLRCAGEVTVWEEDGRVRGILLYDPQEKVGSVFAPTRPMAEALLATRPGTSVFSEQELGPGSETFLLFALNLQGWQPPTPLRYAVRIAREPDLPPVVALTREVSGAADERWFRTFPQGTEVCFVAEVGGRMVGAGWASRVGRHGRIHSLVVSPRYRRIGLGTDLLLARLLWLKALGVEQAISEIYAENRSSQRVAEKAGMTCIGKMFHYPNR